MANILTATEAAQVLRTTDTDADMLQLLPLVDDYIKDATGHDWAADAVIAPKAKIAARILLVSWHEDPGQISEEQGSIGLSAALAQLEATGRMLTFRGAGGTGWCALPGASIGDVVAGLLEISPSRGDASTLFETVISYDGVIKQTSSNNLSLKTYRVRLVPPALP